MPSPESIPTVKYKSCATCQHEFLLVVGPSDGDPYTYERCTKCGYTEVLCDHIAKKTDELTPIYVKFDHPEDIEVSKEEERTVYGIVCTDSRIIEVAVMDFESKLSFGGVGNIWPTHTDATPLTPETWQDEIQDGLDQTW